MRHRLTLYTLLFIYNPLLYGQEYAIGIPHTGPDALLDYPYTISLPYGFPQAFSLGQVHLVNSLTIRWQRGIRIAILHNAKLNKENSLHRVHLQIELSLR